MDLDDFECITKKPLKLDKGKKKSPKSRVKEDSPAEVSLESKIIASTATKAELAFKAKKDKISEGRILKKAAKTHKQRVEEFNKHLDSLSEHYDIPKVSWTK